MDKTMIHDFKLTIINFLVIAFAFTNIETILKPIALSLTIIYTAYKIIELHYKFKDRKNGSDKFGED